MYVQRLVYILRIRYEYIFFIAFISRFRAAGLPTGCIHGMYFSSQPQPATPQKQGFLFFIFTLGAVVFGAVYQGFVAKPSRPTPCTRSAAGHLVQLLLRAPFSIFYFLFFIFAVDRLAVTGKMLVPYAGAVKACPNAGARTCASLNLVLLRRARGWACPICSQARSRTTCSSFPCSSSVSLLFLPALTPPRGLSAR